MKVCSIDGCGNKQLSRGWCGKHYYHWWTKGHPLAPRKKPPVVPIPKGTTKIPGLDGFFITTDARVFSTRSGKPRELRPQLHGMHWFVFVRYGVGTASVRSVPIHQLMLITFVGPRPSAKHMCRHLDGNANNNLASNLVWGTAYENVQDSIRHGTHVSVQWSI